jgi:hypothetical protein
MLGFGYYANTRWLSRILFGTYRIAEFSSDPEKGPPTCTQRADELK